MEALHSHAALPATPVHVAIIMDGNGRWAKARGLPRTEGHRRGVEAVRRSVRAAIELGVGYLTLFGFSSENWNRPATEVLDLMGLLRFYLRKEIKELDGNGVRMRFIGDRSRLDKDIVNLIETAEHQTQANTKLNLVIALSYGGRGDIVSAARALAEDAVAGSVAPSDITESMFQSHLQTADIPDPDLLIRTSGEKRISNFLLWQCAYSELVFTDCLWPDFGFEQFSGAVEEFRQRDRRYGVSVA